jgi:two-component sensor histidine kinase
VPLPTSFEELIVIYMSYVRYFKVQFLEQREERMDYMSRLPVHGRTVLFFVAVFTILTTSLSAQINMAGHRHVLILYSYSRQLPWEAKLIAGIDEVMDGLPLADRPFLYEESLDSGRVGETVVSNETWAAYLSSKYRNVHLDAVMAESQQAANLLLSLPGLFPGVNRYLFHYAQSPSLPPGTGLERRFSTAFDLERALRTIPTVFPVARLVVVVTDRTSVGLARIEQLRELQGRYVDRFRLEVWADFTETELLDRAKVLPKDAAILYLPVQRDREGRPIIPGILAAKLARAASVPVFSHFDSLLDTGIVGGFMVSGDQLGRVMGAIVARGDAAAPVSQAAYAAATMGYYFDSRVLSHWRIADSSLPVGSRILYRERGVFELYWGYFLAAAIAFCLETFLLVALTRLSVQRRRALALLATERANLEAKVLTRTADLAAANADLSVEVTERKHAEERERTAAQEKATLFKELQHRVMNSMGIIASLVSLEAGRAESSEAREVLSNLELRISALASLYDILYDTGGVGKIGLDDYLGRIVDSAAQSLGADTKGISFDRDIEPVSIDLKRAVSLGLILNELVTDCLKYAFPDGRLGRVFVRLSQKGSDLSLEISDDGVGLPPGFDPSRVEGFGLNLVNLLTEQLGGRFEAVSLCPAGTGVSAENGGSTGTAEKGGSAGSVSPIGSETGTRFSLTFSV